MTIGIALIFPFFPWSFQNIRAPDGRPMTFRAGTTERLEIRPMPVAEGTFDEILSMQGFTHCCAPLSLYHHTRSRPSQTLPHRDVRRLRTAWQ